GGVLAPVVAGAGLPLVPGDRGRRHGEGPCEGDAPLLLVVAAILLVGRRAHQEGAGRQHHHLRAVAAFLDVIARAGRGPALGCLCGCHGGHAGQQQQRVTDRWQLRVAHALPPGPCPWRARRMTSRARRFVPACRNFRGIVMALPDGEKTASGNERGRHRGARAISGPGCRAQNRYEAVRPYVRGGNHVAPSSRPVASAKVLLGRSTSPRFLPQSCTSRRPSAVVYFSAASTNVYGEALSISRSYSLKYTRLRCDTSPVSDSVPPANTGLGMMYSRCAFQAHLGVLRTWLPASWISPLPGESGAVGSGLSTGSQGMAPGVSTLPGCSGSRVRKSSNVASVYDTPPLIVRPRARRPAISSSTPLASVEAAFSKMVW